jgi:hypothetical protein
VPLRLLAEWIERCAEYDLADFRCTGQLFLPSYVKRAGPMPAVGSPVVLGLSMFKGLRQADQHAAYGCGIILRERVHDP